MGLLKYVLKMASRHVMETQGCCFFHMPLLGCDARVQIRDDSTPYLAGRLATLSSQEVRTKSAMDISEKCALWSTSLYQCMIEDDVYVHTYMMHANSVC